jgi:hypothetical protein
MCILLHTKSIENRSTIERQHWCALKGGSKRRLTSIFSHLGHPLQKESFCLPTFPAILYIAPVLVSPSSALQYIDNGNCETDNSLRTLMKNITSVPKYKTFLVGHFDLPKHLIFWNGGSNMELTRTQNK